MFFPQAHEPLRRSPSAVSDPFPCGSFRSCRPFFSERRFFSFRPTAVPAGFFDFFIFRLSARFRHLFCVLCLSLLRRAIVPVGKCPQGSPPPATDRAALRPDRIRFSLNRGTEADRIYPRAVLRVLCALLTLYPFLPWLHPPSVS